LRPAFLFLKIGLVSLFLGVMPGESPQSARSEPVWEERIRAIQRGVDGMDAGQTRPFEEFDREFRARHGLPPRA
jgi:hypothetical protein